MEFIIAGVGLILGGLTATGVALSLSRDLVALVGDNVVLILIAGAVVGGAAPAQALATPVPRSVPAAPNRARGL